MESWNKILFANTIEEYEAQVLPAHVLHILCTEGTLNFLCQDTHYYVSEGDLVIMPDAFLASGFRHSENCSVIIMCLDTSFTNTLAIRSNFGVIGGMMHLLNPVLKLSGDDFSHCREDMLLLRRRLNGERNEFWEEMMSHLLMAHILFLYGISARMYGSLNPDNRSAQLLSKFFSLLYRGDYVRNRDLTHYASQLAITPHYLSDVCRKVTGKPASAWIERFTLHEIVQRLTMKDVPLGCIADDMQFSSFAHFSRYTQARLGMPPSQYRQSVMLKNSNDNA